MTERHRHLYSRLEQLVVDGRLRSIDRTTVQGLGTVWIIDEPGQGRRELRTRDAEALAAVYLDLNAEQLTLI